MKLNKKDLKDLESIIHYSSGVKTDLQIIKYKALSLIEYNKYIDNLLRMINEVDSSCQRIMLRDNH